VDDLVKQFFGLLFTSCIQAVNIKSATVFSERELTFTFVICCRPSVCRLSDVCRSSFVCNVCTCALLSRFKFSAMFVRRLVPSIGHLMTSTENFTDIVLGEPLRRRVKRKKGSQIKRFWTCQRIYLGNSAREKVR